MKLSTDDKLKIIDHLLGSDPTAVIADTHLSVRVGLQEFSDLHTAVKEFLDYIKQVAYEEVIEHHQWVGETVMHQSAVDRVEFAP